MNFRIKVSIKGKSGPELELKAEKTVVGRGSKANLVIPDEGISRQHLLIEIENKEKIFLTDLESSNGSFVGEQKLNANERVEYSTFFMPIKLGINVSIEIIQQRY